MTDIDATERPMLFSGWSVRRTKDEAKTQTRRIVKPQPSDVKGVNRMDLKLRQDPVMNEYVVAPTGDLVSSMMQAHEWVDNCFPECPYGEPGDILWGREAFRFPAVGDAISPSEYVGAGCNVWRYEADETVHDPGGWTERHDFEWGRKRPSTFMPYDLCRLRLRIEEIRVERVKEISEEDAKAEGVKNKIVPYRGLPWLAKYVPGRVGTYKAGFRLLWNDLHGDGAWARNDWVWVILFSLLTDAPATP